MLFSKIKILKKNKNAKIPTRATKGSAGFDLYACMEKEMVILKGERKLISTGIAIEIPSEEISALIFSRSGLGAKKGITVSNGVGVIDSDYRGEIFVCLYNLSQEDYKILPNDRIAQMIFIPIFIPEMLLNEELSESDRADDGFGSTGK